MSLDLSSADDAPDLETVVDVLDDADCRAIVSALTEPMTADEVADAAGLPLSTTYRKLDRLREASLISETGRGRADRNRKARYVADFERITVDLDEQRAFRVRIDRAKDRLLGIWARSPSDR